MHPPKYAHTRAHYTHETGEETLSLHLVKLPMAVIIGSGDLCEVPSLLLVSPLLQMLPLSPAGHSPCSECICGSFLQSPLQLFLGPPFQQGPHGLFCRASCLLKYQFPKLNHLSPRTPLSSSLSPVNLCRRGQPPQLTNSEFLLDSAAE